MQYYEYWLVGAIPTPLKNMKVSWDDEIPNIWKVIKFMFQTTNQIIHIYIYIPIIHPYNHYYVWNTMNPKWLLVLNDYDWILMFNNQYDWC